MINSNVFFIGNQKKLIREKRWPLANYDVIEGMDIRNAFIWGTRTSHLVLVTTECHGGRSLCSATKCSGFDLCCLKEFLVL